MAAVVDGSPDHTGRAGEKPWQCRSTQIAFGKTLTATWGFFCWTLDASDRLRVVSFTAESRLEIPLGVPQVKAHSNERYSVGPKTR